MNSDCQERDDFVMRGLLKIINSIDKSKKREDQGDYLSTRKKDKLPVVQTEMASSSDDEDDDSDLSDEPEERNMYASRKLPGKKNHAHEVHQELRDINKRLQQESKRLRSWDLELQERESHLDKIEKKLSTYAASMKETIEKEIVKKCRELEKEYEEKIQQLQEENKKSRNSFKILKKANDTLKAKVSDDQLKLKNYEEKRLSSQSRISNLQRKVEILKEQIHDQAVEYKNSMVEKVKSISHKNSNKDQGSLTMMSTPLLESYSLLLQWIADSHLKENVNAMLKSGLDSCIELDSIISSTNDRNLKIIMFMPDVLRQVLHMNQKVHLSFAEFLYWSMLHLNMTQCMQRLSHSATYRRIGEELFQISTPSISSKENSSKVFYRSSNCNIRILSSLIILQSINQADIVVQVLQSLNEELKGELSKEFFLEHHGTEMLLPLFKLTNRIHLGYASDTLMALVVDSPYMQQFLDELCTVEWVQSIISILKACNSDITVMENLSLILQRMSKVKRVKPIFDALQVKSTITDLLRHPSCEGEYLQLNFRSILLNIEAMRTQKGK